MKLINGCSFPHNRLVKPSVARQRIDADTAKKTGKVPRSDNNDRTTKPDPDDRGNEKYPVNPPKPVYKRFYGSVAIDPLRINRDAGAIADEVVQHLSKLSGATVEITLEIQANIPDGVSDDVMRTLTENSRTLKFKNYSFEIE